MYSSPDTQLGANDKDLGPGLQTDLTANNQTLVLTVVHANSTTSTLKIYLTM